jgi:hypothetical protein
VLTIPLGLVPGALLSIVELAGAAATQLATVR